MVPVEMEVDDPRGWDFVDWVGPDASASIFRSLDDPADIVRAAAVSRSWRRFGSPPPPNPPLLVFALLSLDLIS
jgi:hypothetical protein